MSQSWKVGALAIAVALGIALPAQAVIIDEFDSGSTSFLNVDGTDEDSGLTNVIGGVRESMFTLLASSGMIEYSLDINSSAIDQLDSGNKSGERSSVMLLYDGLAMGMGSLNANLVLDGSFAFNIVVLSTDRAVNVDLAVTTNKGLGTEMTDTVMTQIPADIGGGGPASPFNHMIAFNLFSNFSDFDDVDVIKFTFTPPFDATDFVLERINTTMIPVPAAFPLGMLVMGGLALMRRRRAA